MATGAACLAVTFLLLGIGFALPFPLWTDAHGALLVKSPATLNLYALTAWMGLAHFVYAAQGQLASLRRTRGLLGVIPFALVIALVWIALWGIRSQLNVAVWDAAVWVYFIYHFMKAELFVDRVTLGPRPDAARDYAIPVAAFALMSVVLIWRELFLDRPTLLFLVAIGVAGASLAAGGWQGLFDPRRAPYVVLGMFLVGEALVWGNYARYMSPTFADGVYGFHVAAASFFHYARAYAVPLHRPQTSWFFTLRGIIVANILVIVAGWLMGLFVPLDVPNLVYDPRFFTVWVAWHLVASDLYPLFRAPSKP